MEPPTSPSLKRPRVAGAGETAEPLLCVDLFCGMGGFSCGAVQAGHRVVLAVDKDEPALRLHRANHGDARHECMTLGPGAEAALERLVAQTVPRGARWHMHASPPCQALSRLQYCKRPEQRPPLAQSMDLVNWSLAMLLRLRPTSWSFEQVACRELNGVLCFLKASFPDYVDYATVDLSAYGVCQTRTRVLAGLPGTVHAFLSDPALRAPAPKLSDVLRTPEGAVWQRASVGKNPDPLRTVRSADGTYKNSSPATKFVRSVHATAWTCTASTSAHAYLSADYRTIRSFTPREDALLQTFPFTYDLETPLLTQIQLRRAIGNAYPPLAARKFMQCAHEHPTLPLGG